MPPPTDGGKYGAPGPLVGKLPPRDAAASRAASRSDRKTNNLPSRDQAGDASFLSDV